MLRVKESKTAERIAQVLTVFTFVMMSWVVARALDERPGCVHSSVIGFVKIGAHRLDNCQNESRLSFKNWSQPVPAGDLALLRPLEILEPLKALFGAGPRLAVEIVREEPELFELGRGYVRIGTAWLKDGAQVRRALIMGFLQTRFPQTYTNQFQLEVVTDFLMMSVLGYDRWIRDEGQVFSLEKHMRFATAPSRLGAYCASPFRSLAHRGLCEVEKSGEFVEEDGNIWGLRPLLAVALKRVYDRLPLDRKLTAMSALASGLTLPAIVDPETNSAPGMVAWLQSTLAEHLVALTGDQGDGSAIRHALRELEIETPTKWELTLDITHTPAWREIVEQLRRRSEIVKGERILVFTPEGAKALPSGLEVAWNTSDISSQKHVMIACEWPRPEEAVHVRARHLFAQQTCGKLDAPFWE
mgnify:CR=1 FL=1